MTAAHADYAATIRAWSERIVGAVHDDGPEQVLAHITAALRIPPAPGVDPVVALVTVLAAQVDPEASPDERFGWITAAQRALPAVRPSPRRPVVREPHPAHPALAPCGTRSAYKRHLRRGEVPCRACTTAHSDYDRGRRNRAVA